MTGGDRALETALPSPGGESRATAPILRAAGLGIGYRRSRRPAKVVAEGLNVGVAPAQFVCLVGPNGAGKSTLIRTLTGVQVPLAGKVFLNGRDVHRMAARELAQQVSVVLTERMAATALSVHALVALGRFPYTGWSGRLRSEDEAVVRWALGAVGALDLAGRDVSELSDGEQQKVMIARALAQEPRLMVLDEPTAFLDLPRRVELMHLLRRLARDTGASFLLSTHDLDLALRTADRIWLLPAGGPLQDGVPEDLVLSDAFERTFANEGVSFDKTSGAFRVHGATGGPIGLIGGGVHAFWAQRALEREGYRVLVGADYLAMSVTVTADGDPFGWRLMVGDGVSQVYDGSTLEGLVACLAALEQEMKTSADR